MITQCLDVIQSATELIQEIAVLELEVSNLEQYLLSVYQKAFDQQASIYVSPSSKLQSSISQKINSYK